MVAAAFDWSFYTENWHEFAVGLGRTLMVSAIAIVGSLVIGLVIGAGRAYRIPVVSQFGVAYLEAIRNTPLLVQLFFMFYGLPQLGVRLDASTIAWLGVMIWGGAFNSENFRAGFEAVPARTREAGLALGFSGLGTFLNVTLPIGGRIALPASINTYIGVLKNTTLLYAVTYSEFTFTVLQVNALGLRTIEAFTLLGVVYLAIVWSLSAVIRLLESHLALPERA